jgi:hypothetical protein
MASSTSPVGTPKVLTALPVGFVVFAPYYLTNHWCPLASPMPAARFQVFTTMMHVLFNQPPQPT